MYGLGFQVKVVNYIWPWLSGKRRQSFMALALATSACPGLPPEHRLSSELISQNVFLNRFQG